jgi:redox-regulated HSP33 family molecular chaperone
MVDQICALFGLIWDDAEALKELARQSRTRVVIDTTELGPEATRAANLMAQVLPRVEEEEAEQMARFLAERQKLL